MAKGIFSSGIPSRSPPANDTMINEMNVLHFSQEISRTSKTMQKAIVMKSIA
jgi:hypothetical protein